MTTLGWYLGWWAGFIVGEPLLMSGPLAVLDIAVPLSVALMLLGALLGVASTVVGRITSHRAGRGGHVAPA